MYFIAFIDIHNYFEYTPFTPIHVTCGPRIPAATPLTKTNASGSILIPRLGLQRDRNQDSRIYSPADITTAAAILSTPIFSPSLLPWLALTMATNGDNGKGVMNTPRAKP